jgi:hypothetical protein
MSLTQALCILRNVLVALSMPSRMAASKPWGSGAYLDYARYGHAAKITPLNVNRFPCLFDVLTTTLRSPCRLSSIVARRRHASAYAALSSCSGSSTGT